MKAIVKDEDLFATIPKLAPPHRGEPSLRLPPIFFRACGLIVCHRDGDGFFPGKDMRRLIVTWMLLQRLARDCVAQDGQQNCRRGVFDGIRQHPARPGDHSKIGTYREIIK